MSQEKIAVASPSFSNNQRLREDLETKTFPHKVSFCPQKIELKNNNLIEFLKESSSAIIGKEKINSSLLESCPKLKFISKYGVGNDNIDFDACDACSRVCFPGICDRAIRWPHRALVLPGNLETFALGCG